MARQKGSTAAAKGVTADRAARLHRLLVFLGKGPRSRQAVLRHLRFDVRSFYRDLEVLRASGIEVTLEDRGYCLTEKVADALARLPFPDPHLTLGEAQVLARGREPAHRKLKALVATIVP